MSDKPGAAPVPDEEQERDEDDPGEVGTRFATRARAGPVATKAEDDDT